MVEVVAAPGAAVVLGVETAAVSRAMRAGVAAALDDPDEVLPPRILAPSCRLETVLTLAAIELLLVVVGYLAVA